MSKSGDGADIALRVKAEGNQVRLWIKDAKCQDAYEGLLDKVKDWRASLSWTDLVVFDQNDFVEEWKQASKSKPCFGGSDFGQKIEKDRKFGHKVMQDIGLKLIESLSFKTVKEAVKHLENDRKKHVAKPYGAKVESDMVVIGEMDDNEDIISQLYRFEKMRVPYDGIELEERKEGFEVGVSGWFDGKEWSGPVNVNFEHKRFATGDIGFNTGEMGTVMLYQSRQNRVFRETLDRAKPLLEHVDYRGQIDLNCIVDKDGGIWPLEWTPRLGYPACFIEDELQVTPWGELMWNLAKGVRFENEVRPDWAIGVVVVMFGFPFDNEYKRRSHETPIFGVTDENVGHVHLVEAKLGEHGRENPGLVSASGYGYPLVVTGRGNTIDEAQRKAYGLVSPIKNERIFIPKAWWRTDIGDRISDSISELQSLEVLDGKTDY